ncbi:uncharacterized protein LOC116431278 [Nomia melanderi]|uniref:uncharacterized protein LOC116431278 n=1 Tax=Nomia melanderi TaxID=2448451 RepID=UPI0013044B40|nr:uncharacterized protein LOC116431278 [Nomia melanderi]XP_031842315.1 uncharacterized protein LOC116431278 [Nomia melanderi]
MDINLCEKNKMGVQTGIDSKGTSYDNNEKMQVSDCQYIVNDELIYSQAKQEMVRTSPKPKRTVTKIKVKKSKLEGESSYDSTKLEDSSIQVLERFKRGCECQDDQCFKGLNPETVYRHRLNIAELTKAEHDMYLMGVTMACLTNPYETARHTERRRLRAQYVYQGRRVCLDAFLYLENCTHYQIKRIRKHLMTHGVTPRVHGNHGKIPHNTFSLDIYKIATEFLKSFIELQEAKQKTKVAKNAPLHLPPDITRKVVYDLYIQYCRKVSPNIKIMGYSTFSRFMKVQFPQVKFAKLEFVVRNQSIQSQGGNKIDLETDITNEEPKSTDLITEDGALLPLLIASEAGQSDTYFLTPVSKLHDGMSYQITTTGLLANKPALPITLTKVNAI